MTSPEQPISDAVVEVASATGVDLDDLADLIVGAVSDATVTLGLSAGAAVDLFEAIAHTAAVYADAGARS